MQIHSKRHRKSEENEQLSCDTCQRVFVRSAAYNLHLKKHHLTCSDKVAVSSERLKSEFQCKVCGKGFAKLVFLKRHESRHGEKKFLCSDCGKGFVGKADLQSHIKVHTGEKPHKCSSCNKSFAHAGSLVSHNLAVHSGCKLFNCSACGKSFSQLSHLKVHQRTHSGER